MIAARPRVSSADASGAAGAGHAAYSASTDDGASVAKVADASVVAHAAHAAYAANATDVATVAPAANIANAVNAPQDGPAPVSVIIPFYNGARWIREAVASLVAQQLPPAEIIIVDDASPEPFCPSLLAGLCSGEPQAGVRSCQLPAVHGEPQASGRRSRPAARFYPAIRHLRHAVNRGIAAARNSGVRAATQPWVAFLDQDDLWLPHKLLRQMADAQQQPAGRPPLLYGSIAVSIAVPGRRERGSELWEAPVYVGTAGDSRAVLKDLLLHGNRIPWVTVLCKKDDFLTLGGLDESLRGGCDDYDFVLRAAAAGWRFHAATGSVAEPSEPSEPLAIRREHGSNYTDHELFYQDNQRILAKLATGRVARTERIERTERAEPTDHADTDAQWAQLLRTAAALVSLHAGRIQHYAGDHAKARRYYAEAMAYQGQIGRLSQARLLYLASYVPGSGRLLCLLRDMAKARRARH